MKKNAREKLKQIKMTVKEVNTRLDELQSWCDQGADILVPDLCKIIRNRSDLIHPLRR